MSSTLKLRLIGFALIALSFLALDRGAASASNCPRKSFTGSCIQVIVSARNPDTGECCVYPNPCVVPDGWHIYYSPNCQDPVVLE
jgi:hypothetical protein